MPDQQDTTWGVTVTEVVALASQAEVANLEVTEDGTVVQAAQPDPHFGGAQAQVNRRIDASDVRRWIERGAAVVSAALARRRRLSESHRTEIEAAIPTVIEVWAAAYLVDAAYPARTGVNDQSSYGAVLWARYNQSLAELKQAIGELLDTPTEEEQEADKGLPDRMTAGLNRIFPAPVFTDEFVRESTHHMRPSRLRTQAAPGAEAPAREV